MLTAFSRSPVTWALTTVSLITYDEMIYQGPMVPVLKFINNAEGVVVTAPTDLIGR